MPRLGMIYDHIRWEEKALLLAARRRDVELVGYDAKCLHLEVSSQDGLAERLPSLLLQRCISQYRSLHITAALEGWGKRVVNSLQQAILAQNKLLTTIALRRAGVPVPRTMLAFTKEEALKAAEELGYPLVIKPTMGAWGRLVSLVKDREGLEALLEHRELMHPSYQVYYLQEWVQRPPRDIRAFVIGDRVVAAIYRVSTSPSQWRTNTALGGKAEKCPISKELEDLVLKASSILGQGIFGIDCMEGPQGLLVHEINNTTEFRNTVPATGVDIPGLMIEYLVKEVARG